MNDMIKEKGILDWFAGNHVAANLLMLLILVAGALNLKNTTIEIFPDTSVDVITVSVTYLGASPSEVEEGVVQRVEEAVAGIVGIKEMNSVSMEGVGMVTIEVEEGYDPTEILDKVKAEVDRIITFPEETEKPIITEITTRYQVMSLVLHGDVSEKTLKSLAEHMRDELTAKDNISQVDIVGARRYEISIEVSEENLRRYGLSFDDVSRAIGRSSLDLPGGSVKTRGGEILIRTKGQRYTGGEFEKIVVVTRPDGTNIYLEDIATVIDGFEDSDLEYYFDGEAAVGLNVFRVGDQSVLDLAETCNEYIEEQRPRLPEGVNISKWYDRSLMLKSRMELLIRNAGFGLMMVFLVLSLFLDLRLAFWTTMGIPISFMGAFWVMPYADVSINMLSLFAFILALGIVVDDAIVVGENIFTYREQGMGGLEAAMLGVKEMAAPVALAVFTTVFAFMPLLFVSGIMGKFIRVVPIIVISILMFSLVEALLILPAHLSGGKLAQNRKNPGLIARFQENFRRKLDRFVNTRFVLLVRAAVGWRYLTLSVGALILLTAVGFVLGGHMKYTMFPNVDADNVWASLEMPKGTDIAQTRLVVRKLEDAARAVQAELDAERRKEDPNAPSVFQHIAANIGEQPFTRDRGAGPPDESGSGGNVAEVNVELLKGEQRGSRYASARIGRMWREKVGEIPGVSTLTFTSALFSAGDAINVQMSHYNFDRLLDAADALKEILRGYTGVTDITDSFEPGKVELKLSLTEQGRIMGLTLADLARQVRQGFYGDEVQRIQRGRDDIRVMVRYPEQERKSLADIENMRIRLPDGTEIPFEVVAEAQLGRGYAVIDRSERRRVVSVTADVDQAQANAREINTELERRVLPELSNRFPGLMFSFEGEQKENKEIGESLGGSFLVALFAIFALLAVQFRSYLQPSIIMTAIPFGLVGAIAGHQIMAFYLTVSEFVITREWRWISFDLSLLSIFGIVALTGVVVNDSLIMVDLINRERRGGTPLLQAVEDSATRRFRPIILTTLTTFFGLVPMMLERSLQARFLIPMAVSLAFGVLFATSITLLLVPSLYMILEDIKCKLGIDSEPAGQAQAEPVSAH